MPESPFLDPTAVAALFGEGVVVEVAAPGDDSRDVDPRERAVVERAVPSRRAEFCAGRAAARRALRRLGITGHVLLPGEDRAPRWPNGIAGSISHSQGHCVVVAGRSPSVRALGIDLEPDRALAERLWPKICTPDELARLDSLGAESPGHAVLRVFVAKECFYKCQYSVTRKFLGFQDVEVQIDAAGASFTASVPRTVAPALDAGSTVTGRWYVGNGLLVAGMELRDEGR